MSATAEVIVSEPAALSAQVQQFVDRTLAADRRGGEALWEKCCVVADAKAATKHGDWIEYLGAVGMHEREARRLMGIAHRGRQSAEFRDKVISGWLRFSVAAIVAQSDEGEMHRLLSQDTPPTVKQLAPAAPAKSDNVVRLSADVLAVPDATRSIIVGPYAYLKSCAGCGTTEYLLKDADGAWRCEPCMGACGQIYDPSRLSSAERARRLGGELECRQEKGKPTAYVLVFPGREEQVFASTKQNPGGGLYAANEVLSAMEQKLLPPTPVAPDGLDSADAPPPEASDFPPEWEAARRKALGLGKRLWFNRPTNEFVLDAGPGGSGRRRYARDEWRGVLGELAMITADDQRNNESDSRGIWPAISDDKIPEDWDLWRDRAVAADCRLRIIHPEMIKLQGPDGGGVETSLGGWLEVKGLIAMYEQKKVASLGTGKVPADKIAAQTPAAEPARKPLVCRQCGWEGTGTLYTNDCESCYHVRIALQQPVGSEDMRWNLRMALRATEGMPATLRRARVAHVRDVAEAHGIDLDSQPAAPAAPAQSEPALAPPHEPEQAEVLRGHAEALIAGWMETIPDQVVKLLALISLPDEFDVRAEDPRERLWAYWREGIEYGAEDLGLIL